MDHAVRAGLLLRPHKDSFDRMLIAQAQAENIPIISKELIFDSTVSAASGKASHQSAD